jgi:HAD superfamily hydrolase (TIGR01509 family)
MPADAVIFDFDGLLMDTESTNLASWQYEWAQHGLDLDAAAFFADHGGDISRERYAALAAAAGPDYDRSASHARRTAYRDRLNAALELAPGIGAWLREAAAGGLRLAVASSSPGSWVRRHLAQVSALGQFEVLACGDEVAAPKPDPAVYRLALQRLGLPPDAAVAVEDSPHGAVAAQAAGLRCIAIPNPHADPARFTTADLVLPSAVGRTLAEAITAMSDG